MHIHVVGTWVMVVVAGHAAASDTRAGLPPFTEESTERGVVYVPSQVQNHGQGVAFVDLDNDGDPDLVAIGAGSGQIGVFENDGGGQFTVRPNAIPSMVATSGVIAGDYDNDGDADIYISRWEEPNRLLRNDGKFMFTDVTDAAGVGDDGHGTGCTWGDIDGDGWLDLYVANWGNPNRLYLNLGGTFIDVADDLNVDAGFEPTFQASFTDFDLDGDPDLYLATDRGTLCEEIDFRNHLFENIGGVFVDITEQSGTEACVDAMCIAIGDFDGNGFNDFYCTNTPPGNVLLMNQGDGTFTEEAAAAGVEINETGWGSVFLDFDNDANLDLYVCNMFSVANRLFRNTGSWPAEDLAADLNLANTGPSYTVAVADVDLDHDLDLLLQNRGEPLRLFLNHAGNMNHGVRLVVRSENGAHAPIGAFVRVSAAGETQLREIQAGSNFKNQNEMPMTLGLANATIIDAIEVNWPTGTTRTLTGYAAAQTWTIYPPDQLGDSDFDGDRDVDDLLNLLKCFTGSGPGQVEPDCAIHDIDGDGDVDSDDLLLLLALWS